MIYTFYLLFYFLRDQRAVLRSLRALSPLSEADMERLFSRVGDTVHATMYGTLAVAVIQGKTIVFSKGYGARVQGEAATIDTATVFQIGSISKSFTATVMGSLVDEGKAAFEDRGIDRYPSCQMYDPWVTREFMIWDLMAQHSGMAPYAGDTAVTIGFTRQDFVKGLRHLKPVSSFRSEFAYVNNLWLAVAALQETLTGRKWVDLVAARVFAPLGMTSATTTVDGLLKGANVALPHVLVDGVQVLKGGEHTGATPGRAVRGPGWRRD